MHALSSVRRILVIAFAGALSLGSDCDDDPTGIVEGADFQATLTGAAQFPDPVTTDATGRAFFDVDGSIVRFRIEVEDIQNVTLAHVRVSTADGSGPIAVELFNAGGSPRSFTTRAVLVEATFTQADVQPVPPTVVVPEGISTLDQLLDEMEVGNTYVNVHTTANPSGEIRGQIEEN